MRRLRRSALLASTLTLAVAGSVRPLGAQTPAHLRVGATAADTFAEAFFALDNGRFRKADLDVEMFTLNNSNAIAAAVAGGRLDIGVTSPIQLATGFLHGIPFKLIAAGSISTAKAPSTVLCVLKTSTIRSAKDLEGKVVCMNVLKSVSELALNAWFAQRGADISKLKIIETVHSEMVPSMQRGGVDGAIFSEPSLTIALETNVVKPLTELSSPIARQFLSSGWFVMEEFAQRNADVVRRFADAIHDTGRWANANQSESGRILAKYSKLDPQVVRTMVRAPFTDALRSSDIQPLLDVAVKFGMLSRPVSASDLIYGV